MKAMTVKCLTTCTSILWLQNQPPYGSLLSVTFPVMLFEEGCSDSDNSNAADMTAVHSCVLKATGDVRVLEKRGLRRREKRTWSLGEARDAGTVRGEWFRRPVVFTYLSPGCAFLRLET